MKGQSLLNLLFWITNSFCTFHDFGRGGAASPDGTSLIFCCRSFPLQCHNASLESSLFYLLLSFLRVYVKKCAMFLEIS